MKNLFVLMAIILVSGYSFAQSNTSTVDQTGSNQTATVTQTGGSNSSDIDQTSPAGSKNTATVNQNGTGNTADVDQKQQNSLVGPNNAMLTQDGSSNYGKQEQVGTYTGYNKATMLQDGDSNHGEQIQKAYNETATLTQYQNGNKGYQTQYGTHIQATMTQDGFDNEGYQEQYGLNNKMTLTQTGNLNKSYQEQHGGYYNPPGGHTMTATMTGDGNFTNQYQSGSTSNTSSIELKKEDALYSDGNQVYVNQIGSYNSSSILVAGGSDNLIFHDQINDSHIFNMSLWKADGNTVDVDQYGGNGNRGMLKINHFSDDNNVVIWQNGSNNYATGQITQNGNDINVYQEGTGNRVGTDWNHLDGFKVDGNNNMVDIDQFGTSHKSWNNVAGDNNTITVYQTN